MRKTTGSIILLPLLFVLLAAAPVCAICEFTMGTWTISLGSDVACLAPQVLGPIGWQSIGTIPVDVYMMTSSTKYSISMYEQSTGAKPFSDYNFETLAAATLAQEISLKKDPQIVTQLGRQWALASGKSGNNNAYAGCTLLDDYAIFSFIAFDKKTLEDGVMGFSATQEGEFFSDQQAGTQDGFNEFDPNSR